MLDQMIGNIILSLSLSSRFKTHEKTIINTPFIRINHTFRRSWCFSRGYSEKKKTTMQSRRSCGCLYNAQEKKMYSQKTVYSKRLLSSCASNATQIIKKRPPFGGHSLLNLVVLNIFFCLSAFLLRLSYSCNNHLLCLCLV